MVVFRNNRTKLSKVRAHLPLQDGVVVSNETAAHGWMKYHAFDSSYLLMLTAWQAQSLLDAPSRFRYRLGDHIIDYPMSHVGCAFSAEPDGVWRFKTFIKVQRPE